MEDLKTYFFIAGVAHEGEDKEWVRAEDVYQILDNRDRAAQELYNDNVKLFNENAELRTEVKELKDTQAMLSTCGYVEWKQFQRENGE